MDNKVKKMGKLVLTFIMVFSLTACGSSGGNSTAGSGTTEGSTMENNTAESSTVENITAENSTTESSTMENNTEENITGSETEPSGGESSSNMLVAYFSLAGEQYNVGVIEEGNTSIIAHMIAEQTGAELFEIEAVTPYSETHSELLEVSRQEMAADARPEIVGTVDNMDDYDTIFIGYPNWWGDMPMIVYHFIESYDFTGKTIVPFCTHGGSGLSGTERAIANITGASMMDGFAISGETAQNDRERSRDEVNAWLRGGGFIE